MAASFSVGEILEGKWRIEAVIGEGGMGTVFRATDVLLDRVVAIKALRDSVASESELLERFEREAKLTAKLEHPSIVPIYAVGRHRGHPFIVMKHLEGTDLSTWLKLKTFPLPPEEVLGIVRQIASGLSHVHAHGFVHRDLKPSNLFMGNDGQICILDFGISRDAKQRTQTGSGWGSVKYMAPEQLEGRHLDHRTDLYAFGVILFQLFTGEAPYAGASDATVAYQHVHSPIPTASTRASWVTPAVSSVLARALQKNPGARYQSAAELVRSLELSLQGQQEPLLSDETKRARPPKTGSHRLGLAAVAVVAMALGGAAAYGVSRVILPRPKPQPPVVAPRIAAAPPEPIVPESAPDASVATVQLDAAPDVGDAGVAVALGGVPAPVATKPAEPKPSKPRPVAKPAAKAKLSEVRVVTSHAGKPTWAMLKVNGKAAGGTPATLNLPAGNHLLTVERPGFRTVQKELRVSSSKPASVRIELSP